MSADAAAQEALIRDYIRLWNARDAAAVCGRIYRSTAEHPMPDEAKLNGLLAGLEAEGFSHTELLSVTTRPLGDDAAEAQIAFRRVDGQGAPVGPDVQEAAYGLRRFPDGWRITRILWSR